MTRYVYDASGYLTQIVNPLGKPQMTYTYDAAGRIDGITDALGQTRRFQYGMDDLLTGLSYENALNAMPPVSFSYDPYYPRRTAMLDGTGLTTYAY